MTHYMYRACRSTTDLATLTDYNGVNFVGVNFYSKQNFNRQVRGEKKRYLVLSLP